MKTKEPKIKTSERGGMNWAQVFNANGWVAGTKLANNDVLDAERPFEVRYVTPDYAVMKDTTNGKHFLLGNHGDYREIDDTPEPDKTVTIDWPDGSALSANLGVLGTKYCVIVRPIGDHDLQSGVISARIHRLVGRYPASEILSAVFPDYETAKAGVEAFLNVLVKRGMIR
jgi:hypothetical protein